MMEKKREEEEEILQKMEKAERKRKKFKEVCLYYSVETAWITVSYDTGAIGTSNGEEENAS